MEQTDNERHERRSLNSFLKTRMAFSIDTALRLLTQRFEPDLSVTVEASDTDLNCYATIEAILVENAIRHQATKFAPPSPHDDVGAQFEAESEASDKTEADRVEPWLPIEKKMTPERMQRIWEFDRAKGRKKCLAKFGIKYSQLRAVRRHFSDGGGDNEKCRQVQSSVKQAFTQVVIHQNS